MESGGRTRTIQCGMPTVRQVLEESVERLEPAGIGRPREDAEILLADALGVDRRELDFSADTHVGDADRARIEDHVARRAAREPLAYIVGRVRFRGLELRVDSRVHVPRDDRTGLLVDVAIEAPPGARVHDVGTGCGAVALAVKNEREDLAVSGSDISSSAIEVARSNATRLGLAVGFKTHDGLPGGDLDLVVANLPYSAQSELDDGLAPESSRYQPHVALIAGRDALDAIRAFLSAAPSGLLVALEHAPEQTAGVRALLDRPTTRRDAAGDERVTVGLVR
jgi:release factor glutamine methyltransferase